MSRLKIHLVDSNNVVQSYEEYRMLELLSDISEVITMLVMNTRNELELIRARRDNSVTPCRLIKYMI